MRRTRIPQADGGRERESSEFKRNLNGGPQADCFGETAIAINDQQLKEKNYISTDGGPQADCFDERELSGMKRELKEIGPQADEGCDE